MILRRIGAVFAGFLVIVILSTVTDIILHASSVFPPWGQPMSNALFGLATAYRIVFSIFGCYITAWLAPDRPMQHALALGILGIIVSAAGAAATWNPPQLGPHWYPVALIAVSIPCAWLGGWLYSARTKPAA